MLLRRKSSSLPSWSSRIKTYKTLSFKLCNAFALYGLGLPGRYGSTTSAATDVLHKTLGLSVHRYHLGDTADIFSVI